MWCRKDKNKEKKGWGGTEMVTFAGNKHALHRRMKIQCPVAWHKMPSVTLA